MKAPIGLSIEIAGRRLGGSQVGDAVKRHAVQAQLGPTHIQAARRLVSESAVTLDLLTPKRDRIDLHASVVDAGRALAVEVHLGVSEGELVIQSSSCDCGRPGFCRHAAAAGLHLASHAVQAATPASTRHFAEWIERAAALPAAGADLTHAVTLWPQPSGKAEPFPVVPSDAPAENTSPPLGVRRAGAAQAMTAIAATRIGLEWRVLESGEQRLRWSGSDGRSIVALFGRAYGFDAQRDELSSLGWSIDQVLWISQCPPVPVEQSAAARASVSASGLALPLPASFAGIKERKVRPLVKGRLVPVAIRHNRRLEMVSTQGVTLHFDYPSNQPLGELSIEHGQPVRNVPDRAFEQDLVHHLIGCRMEAVSGIGKGKRVGEPYCLISAGARLHPERDFLQAHLGHLVDAGVALDLDGLVYERRDEFELQVQETPARDFQIRLQVSIGDRQIDLTCALVEQIRRADFPWEAPAREAPGARMTLLATPGVFVSVPLERVRAVGLPLREVLEGRRFAAGMAVEIRPLQALEFERFVAGSVDPQAARLRAAISLIKQGRVPVQAPENLNGELRPYQLDGLAWLTFLAQVRAGGVLADDMGLGKTVQVLAHVLSEQAMGRLRAPVLVVAPLSILGVWRGETARFAPTLNLRCAHGAKREAAYQRLTANDVVLITYGTLVNDIEMLATQRWGLVVCDEAQTLKNPETQASAALARLPRERALMTSGTPIENRLLDLWSLLNHAQPGAMGSREHFGRIFRTAIERDGDPARRDVLRRKIAPLVLRRLKSEVAAELPPKTHQIFQVPLEGEQRRLYESIRLSLRERVMKEVHEHGLERSGMLVLDALLRLRQACCSPRLLKNVKGPVPPSAKQALLLDQVRDLTQAGRKVLVYSQYAGMIELIARDFDAAGIDFARMTGETRDRRTPVEQFTRGEKPVFLLTLKVGNAGLNLQQADTVILYDPWWNGAVEVQAEDRAHRIGQINNVTVYRYVCPGTVEEKVLAIAQRKLRVAASVLDPDAAMESSQWLTMEELEGLFAPIRD